MTRAANTITPARGGTLSSSSSGGSTGSMNHDSVSQMTLHSHGLQDDASVFDAQMGTNMGESNDLSWSHPTPIKVPARAPILDTMIDPNLDPLPDSVMDFISASLPYLPGSGVFPSNSVQQQNMYENTYENMHGDIPGDNWSGESSLQVDQPVYPQQGLTLNSPDRLPGLALRPGNPNLSFASSASGMKRSPRPSQFSATQNSRSALQQTAAATNSYFQSSGSIQGENFNPLYVQPQDGLGFRMHTSQEDDDDDMQPATAPFLPINSQGGYNSLQMTSHQNQHSGMFNQPPQSDRDHKAHFNDDDFDF